MFILSLQLFLVVQNNYEAAADEHRETHTDYPDESSAANFTAVESYLNYKATHHEGKVSVMLQQMQMQLDMKLHNHISAGLAPCIFI